MVLLTAKSQLVNLPHRILEGAARAGIELREEDSSGVYFHVDQNTLFSQVNEHFEGKIEVMDTKEALETYPWLEDFRWKLIDRNQDEYTRKVDEKYSGGYFMRILPGAEITFPLQSCLLMTRRNSEQRVHNLIIAEKGSNSQILTTCVQHIDALQATHLGVSEIYVRKGAKLNFTMVHHWGEDTKVRPRSAALIDDGGEFVSNYICLTPVRDIQMFPAAYCNGEDSRALFNNILYVQEGSHMDIGAKAELNGKGSKAELNTRAVAKGNSKLTVRGMIIGNNQECKGHLECRGLVLDDNSVLEAIPILRAIKKGADLTHEAAVGKLSEQEIVYLMSRRMKPDDAVGALIRGFMDVSIMGLPRSISEEIEKIVDKAAEAS
jgi:Fe-S cluster assembly scaffold protein SufB